MEIAFLASQGVSLPDLTLAAQRARRRGTDPVRELFASGLLGPDAYYRALAAELGLPFHDGDVDLAAGGRHEAILGAGIAPVAGRLARRFRFLLAPEGPALRHMIEAGPRRRGDVAVTTPRLFAARLRDANDAGLALQAAGLDEAGLARESARTGAGRGQVVAIGIGLATATLGGVLAPLQSFFALALLLGPLFLGLILLRLAASMERAAPDLWRTQRWRLDDSRLPVYTVAVPMYREEAVLRQMLKALSELDYPALGSKLTKPIASWT